MLMLISLQGRNPRLKVPTEPAKATIPQRKTLYGFHDQRFCWIRDPDLDEHCLAFTELNRTVHTASVPFLREVWPDSPDTTALESELVTFIMMVSDVLTN